MEHMRFIYTLRTLIFVELAMFMVSTGCGPTKSTTELSESLPGSEFIKAFMDNRGVVLVSGPSDIIAASACESRNSQCISQQVSKLVNIPVATVTDRKIFDASSIGFANGKEFVVQLTSSSQTYRRKFDFTSGSSGASHWKSLFLAGDYQDQTGAIVAWDNARRDIAAALIQRGFPTQGVRHLSMNPALVTSEPNVLATSRESMTQAMASWQIGANDQCFVFMTSHGLESGFTFKNQPELTSEELDGMLTKYCGNRPTVALISACHAGVFMTQSMQMPHRVIFAAAAADRTSEGCKPGIKYNLFDECLLLGFKDSKVQTWNDLQVNVDSCVTRLEQQKNAKKSVPQYFIGTQMQNQKINGGSGSNVVVPIGPNVVTPIIPQGQISGTKNIALVTANKTATDLSSVIGGAQYALIDFSESWCGACQEFAAKVDKVHAQLEQSGKCKLVTIVPSDKMSAWTAAAKSQGATRPEIFSYETSGLSLGKAYTTLYPEAKGQEMKLPSILIYDVQQNKVIKQTVGAQDPTVLMSSYCN